MHNEKEFIQYLKKSKGNVRLFCDIETCTVNKNVGRKYPSKYHSFSFSLAISFFLNNDFPGVFICNTFKEMYELIFKYGKKTNKYILNFHNGNKFDNHFLISETVRIYPQIQIKNMYLKNAVNNKNCISKQDLSQSEKDNTLLEKRVKSSNSVEFELYLNQFTFISEDNFLKTNTSIATIGKKLLDKKIITIDYLKTDFDYTKYDLDEDIDDKFIDVYRKQIFDNLTNDELTYIKNDVILLALCFKYYKKLFFNFDYREPTFTSNIKKEYCNNSLSEFQLLKKVGKSSLKYTDYTFYNANLFDYLKRFYKGGLNFYNQKYLGKILKNGFSIDINSSYPYVMYFYKLPTYIHSFHQSNKPFKITIDINTQDYITFFTIPIELANSQIINKIPSKIVRQMIVKYYNSIKGDIYISSVTLKLIAEIFNIDLSTINVTSFVTFKCLYFGARTILAQNYYIKTQGKQKKKINFESPVNITLTDEDNPQMFSADEIAGSKVLLNGIYGIPALRAYFDLFRRDDNNKLFNIKNGFENNERNIIFSAAVTAYAFYDLLQPLKYIPVNKIDELFWYCDTDSLYMDNEAKKYMPTEMFDKLNLGKWDMENDLIDEFYILNHKKYCYNVDNHIKIRSGGVRKSSFNTNVSFKSFVKNQFSEGCKIQNLRSIRNEWNTISIYPAFTNLEMGKNYQDEYNLQFEKEREEIIKTIHDDFIKEEGQHLEDELLYIETEYGTISATDFIPDKKNDGIDMTYFLSETQRFKKLVEKGLS